MATDLDSMKVSELREQAKAKGVRRYSKMNKSQLVDALSGAGGNGNGGDRAVTQTEATKYDQVVESPGEHEEREGRSLVTTDHDVIRQWADARDAKPATVPGTEHDGHLGVLRLDFPGYGGDDLRSVSWDEWFRTFDARNLNFIYQEHKADGSTSNFFRLENPDREDA